MSDDNSNNRLIITGSLPPEVLFKHIFEEIGNIQTREEELRKVIGALTEKVDMLNKLVESHTHSLEHLTRPGGIVH
jgi:hypothetical protein